MTSQSLLQRRVMNGPFYGFDQPSNSFGDLLRRQLAIDVDRTVGVDTVPVHEAVCRVLARHISEPELLDGLPLQTQAATYTRHLLHEGQGYSILAIVWMPGQASPAHSHRAWCALGVHQGVLVETHLKAGACPSTGRPTLSPVGCRQLTPGTVSGGAADPDHYHRVANLGTVPAVTIHVYGALFDRLGIDLNTIWAG